MHFPEDELCYCDVNISVMSSLQYRSIQFAELCNCDVYISVISAYCIVAYTLQRGTVKNGPCQEFVV